MEVREPHPPSAPVAGDVCPATTTVGVTLLTPSGHGALAVVAVAGPAAGRLVDRTFTPRSGRPVSSRSDGAICVGHWRTNGGGPGEELVVVRHRADLIEVHCHGGLAAPAIDVKHAEQFIAKNQRRADLSCYPRKLTLYRQQPWHNKGF